MLDRPNNSIDRPRIFTQDSLLLLGCFKQVGEHLCRTEAQPKGNGTQSSKRELISTQTFRVNAGLSKIRES